MVRVSSVPASSIGHHLLVAAIVLVCPNILLDPRFRSELDTCSRWQSDD